MPTIFASVCNTVTATHAAAVPIPPITAVIGITEPLMRTPQGSCTGARDPGP